MQRLKLPAAAHSQPTRPCLLFALLANLISSLTNMYISSLPSYRQPFRYRHDSGSQQDEGTAAHVREDHCLEQSRKARRPVAPDDTPWMIEKASADRAGQSAHLHDSRRQPPSSPVPCTSSHGYVSTPCMYLQSAMVRAQRQVRSQAGCKLPGAGVIASTAHLFQPLCFHPFAFHSRSHHTYICD